MLEPKWLHVYHIDTTLRYVCDCRYLPYLLGFISLGYGDVSPDMTQTSTCTYVWICMYASSTYASICMCECTVRRLMSTCIHLYEYIYVYMCATACTSPYSLAHMFLVCIAGCVFVFLVVDHSA